MDIQFSVNAPYDSELNPDGEHRLRSKEIHCAGKHRKTQRDSTPSKGKKTWWDMLSQPKFCMYTPPMHWREMRLVGGPGYKHNAPYEEKMWCEVVQKILFADAIYGTATPTKALDPLLHY